MASLGDLPEEVMIEILSRLPPESLLRFKCVGKCWYALIKSPKFAIKHFANFHKSSATTVLLKRLVTKESGEKQNVFSFLKFPLPDRGSASVVEFDLPFDEDFKYFELSGHSHGLVCLSDIRGEIFLCNPATREFRQPPPSILLITEPREKPDGYHSYTNAVGFGYDPRSRDFKVVRVVNFGEGANYLEATRVEVYDLGKDRWREIKTPVCGFVFWAPSFEMCHQGIYYWWASSHGDTEIIQSFDMSEEVFGAIPVPESFEQWDAKYRSLGVWKGSIVLLHYLLDADEKTFDIWAMEKDNNSGGVSWSKALTIEPVSGLVKSLAFVSSDELLMEAKDGQVILYNLNIGQVKELELPVKGHTGLRGTILSESLLSLKGANNFSFEF